MKQGDPNYEREAKFICAECAMLYDKKYAQCHSCLGELRQWKGTSAYEDHMRLFHGGSDSYSEMDRPSDYDDVSESGCEDIEF